VKSFTGKTLGWEWRDRVIELTLDREPANEIGTAMLAELEQFVAAFPALIPDTAERERVAGVRTFIERIHAVFNAIDAAPFVTIAAVTGVCFGGGFELALTCDIIIADAMARFAFPELRLGLIPGFGGIPRLKRDVGNAFLRDLLLTGRSVNAARAQVAGLVAQLAAEGETLRAARSAAMQITKFDAVTRAAAKKFVKPVPHEDLRREVDLFCELFARPTVMAALKKFVESSDAMPYLP
jgi:enoyl-CoA hydratase/carnithine racemase